MKRLLFILLIALSSLLIGCDALEPGTPTGGETGEVVRVVDGDTIEVRINGQIYDVRYVGVNTPERDEPCFNAATDFNARLVAGESVRLVRDESNTDRYDRLLRYIYVGDTFVNRELVEEGYAEAVLYEPDDEYYQEFRQLEIQAANNSLGCHPTGIFDDGSATR
jgi:micrococcal nuclease